MENLLEDLFLDDVIVEDEIDQAFNILPLIAPPPTLVDNIMAAVAQLPLPPQTFSPDSLWDTLGILHVSLEPLQLS
jgi:hypothetical protein